MPVATLHEVRCTLQAVRGKLPYTQKYEALARRVEAALAVLPRRGCK